ncbi:conserved hypothetical protein [gamma proteobacterium HdN1]|nr:conserved hypothetical protein [gamma proteobacterium HdN1]
MQGEVSGIVERMFTHQGLGIRVMTAADYCLLAAGVFFMTGLLTGVWKYRKMMTSVDTLAPVYVDIAHRASLMYSFAAILMREFVPYSPLGETATSWAVGIPLLFFGSAIITYITHGFLQDTENQLARPHVLGSGHLPGFLVQGYMVALIVGEIGGFAVLFWGFLKAVL